MDGAFDGDPARPSLRRIELTPAEIAQRAGVAVSALHFYEREGLITSRRTSGNQRRYQRDTLRRIAFIRVSQSLGISLRQISAALATLPADRPPSKADWTRLSAGWRDDLEARIQQLVKLRDTLKDCIGCGCLSLRSCSLYNRQDELAAVGSGPQRLLVRRADLLERPGETVAPALPTSVEGRR